MDEMKLKLSTKLMRGMVSKIISKVIFNKIGVNPNIKLNEIQIETVGDKIHFHINADGHIEQNDLLKVTRLANLDDK